jgi:membrane protein implicated in regulation of membrane protease activity
MVPVFLVAVGTLALAVILVALLPGAGLVAAAVVVVLGVACAVWLFSAAAVRESPAEVVSGVDDADLLGPGGPDDPRR